MGLLESSREVDAQECGVAGKAQVRPHEMFAFLHHSDRHLTGTVGLGLCFNRVQYRGGEGMEGFAW